MNEKIAKIFEDQIGKVVIVRTFDKKWTGELISVDLENYLIVIREIYLAYGENKLRKTAHSLINSSVTFTNKLKWEWVK